MSSRTYGDIRSGLEEIREIIRGEKEAPVTYEYSGRIMIREIADGEELWAFGDGAADLRTLDTSGYGNEAELLRAVRETLRQSQAGMSEILGIPRATYINWESGRTKPNSVAISLVRVALEDSSALLHANRTRKREFAF